MAAASLLRVSDQYKTSAAEDFMLYSNISAVVYSCYHEIQRIYWDGFTTLLSPQSHSIAADTSMNLFHLFLCFIFPKIQSDQFSSLMLILCEIIWELQHICRTSMNLLQKPFSFLLNLIVLWKLLTFSSFFSLSLLLVRFLLLFTCISSYTDSIFFSECSI